MLGKNRDLLIKRSSGAQAIAESLGIGGISGTSGISCISGARDKSLNQLLSFVKDDSIAISYQSLGQYRNELIKMIRNILEVS